MKRAFLLLMSLWAAVSFCRAQDDYGIFYKGERVSEFAISASSPGETVTAVLPQISGMRVSWSAVGGIEIVSQTSTQAVIKPKAGKTYESSYASYAKGVLSVKIIFPSDLPEGCDDCVLAQYLRNQPMSYVANVYKTYPLDGNAIVGPSCMVPGDSVTLSVAPWASLLGGDYSSDEYYWDIPSSLVASNLYYSADHSSVTFVASSNVDSQVVKVNIGKYNVQEGNSQTPLELRISDEAKDPQISGMAIDNSYCLPLGAKEATFVVTNASPRAQYNWDLYNWRITRQSANGDTITFIPKSGAQNIKLDVVSGCSTKTFRYDVNRSLTGNNEVLVDGGVDKCLSQETEYDLTVKGSPDDVELVWNVAGAGWKVKSDEGDKLSVVSGTERSIIRVFSERCPSFVVVDTINLIPKMPGIIHGNDCLNPSAPGQQTYYIDEVKNADGYRWTIPSGWVANTGLMSNTITVSVPAQTPGRLSVRALGCKSSPSRTKDVSMAFPAPEGITEDDCVTVGEAGTAKFSVKNPNSAVTYVWTYPYGFARSISPITSNSSQVMLATTGRAGYSDTIKVRRKGGCGNQAFATLVVEKTNPIRLDINHTARRTEVSLNDDVVSDDNVVTWSWFLGSRDNALSDMQDLESVLFNKTNEYFYEGKIWIEVTYADGCKAVLDTSWSFPQNKSGSLLSSNDADLEYHFNNASADGSQVLEVTGYSSMPVLHVYDVSGALVYNENSAVGHFEIQPAELGRGLFLFVISDKDNSVSFKKLMR